MKPSTIARLQAAIADASQPAMVRRAAALRLARLRAATTTASKGLTITTRATPPAPSEVAKFEAVQGFHALSRHRTALYHKRRTPIEHHMVLALAALMPASVPTSDDPQTWNDFIAKIDGTLSEIKSIKPL